MAYEPGEIYFVREQERTGRDSAFVKIGLVRYREKRDSYNRLAEHQTGNPRKLHLIPSEIVKTQAVDMVEAQMHRLFASRRVSGEWFEFGGEGEIAEAVAKAQALASEAAEIVPVFDQAAAFKMQASVSSGGRVATEQELEWGHQIACASAEIKLIKEAQDAIKQALVAAVDAGQDVSAVAKKKVINYEPKFLEEDFAEAHPDLYEQYKADVRDWENKFLPKAKVKNEQLDAEFLDVMEGITSIITGITDHSQVYLLNIPSLDLTHLLGLAEWKKDLASARLQVALGTDDEIKGVCTWKRYERITRKFQSDLFAAEHPDLAKQFLSDPVSKEYVNVKKTKS